MWRNSRRLSFNSRGCFVDTDECEWTRITNYGVAQCPRRHREPACAKPELRFGEGRRSEAIQTNDASARPLDCPVAPKGRPMPARNDPETNSLLSVSLRVHPCLFRFVGCRRSLHPGKQLAITLQARRAMAWAPVPVGSFSGTYSTKVQPTILALAVRPWIRSSVC